MHYIVFCGLQYAYSVGTEGSLEHNAFMKQCLLRAHNAHDPFWLANNPPRQGGGDE